MYEIRFYINSITDFRNVLKKRQAKLIKKFMFKDEYFFPIDQSTLWESGEVSLRIRSFSKEQKLLYAEYNVEIIQETALVHNRLGEKLTISNNKELIASFLDKMQCNKAAQIERLSGEVYTVPLSNRHFECTLEEINGYGWTTEVEIDNINMNNLSETIDFFQKSNCRPLRTTFLADFLKNI